MKLKKITKSNFNKYYDLLEQDFCFEERRTREDELCALADKKFKPYFIYIDDELVGYFTYWEFEDFLFGEHFAILKDKRCGGYGSRFLKEFLPSLNKQLVFEIEMPISKDQKRRKTFYERQGIKINKYKYQQEPYHKGDKPIDMLFVSYPNKLKKQEFDIITKQIKNEIYFKMLDN